MAKEDLYRLENTEKVQWMSASAWAYRTILTVPK